MGFSTPPGHRNPTYDSDTDGFIDQTKGVNVPAYEEDPNSPFSASSTTGATFTLANPADRVVVLTDTTTLGQNRLQLNGFTGPDYDNVANDGTLVSNDTSFLVGFPGQRHRLTLTANDFRSDMSVQPAVKEADGPVSGVCRGATRPITDLRFFNTSGSARPIRFRVFALDV